jgi:hypothetical protein
MTHRKREIIGLGNERDFPHVVELTFPPGGFRSVFLEIDAFHRERRIPDAATADAFRNRFGGECLTHAATSSDAPAVKRIDHSRPKRRVRAIQYGRR